jgi:salicylate hydroxylase
MCLPQGIGGLATAYALAKNGHRVQVFEKYSSNSPHVRVFQSRYFFASYNPDQQSVGLRVPPNLTKILLEWGLSDDLRLAPKCRKSLFHTCEYPLE